METVRPTVVTAVVTVFAAAAQPALAGPPYVTDDPQPTSRGHYEIYTFAAAVKSRGGADIAGGLDFNFGAADNLQLTAVFPVAVNDPKDGRARSGLGRIELAAKYKLIRQDSAGFDLAVFPRVFLPAGDAALGERHGSLLLPVWVSKSVGAFTAFGGGGCTINRGGGSHDYCQAGAAFTWQMTPVLQVGSEFYGSGSDSAGGRTSSGIGAGVIYDLSERFHLLGSYGGGLTNAAETNKSTWYLALLTTF